MGLDSGLIMRVKNTSTGTTISREIAYWRKYWELRNKIVERFNINDNSKFFFKDADTLLSLIELIDFEVRKAVDNSEHLSTIWELEQEYTWTRLQVIQMKLAYQWLIGHFNNVEFLQWVISNFDDWSDEDDKDSGGKFLKEILAAEENSEPLFFEVEFEFYDSY